MCGRFINLNKKDYLNKVFELKLTDIKYITSYNIAPTNSANILTNIKNFELEEAKWGFYYLDKNTNMNKLVFNSRLETIKEKYLFKESYEKRKCIIPANGYFEWIKEEKNKTPYFIHIPENEPIFFAGIWKYLNFKENFSKIFSIITKPANNLINNIHHRMPVIMSIDESVNFLNNNNFIDKNFVSNIEEYLEYYKISSFVNNPINNSINCIKIAK